MLLYIAKSFWRWYKEGYWGAYSEVFDIGGTTRQPVVNCHQGVSPLKAGGTGENSNGNGCLMRILPMAYFYQTWTFQELIERVHQVSCITHTHLSSQMARGIYISIAVQLLAVLKPKPAYLQGLDKIQSLYSSSEYALEKPHFDRVFSDEIARIPIEEINSGGYVIDTLEASLWCLLNSSSYAQAVLISVNLGGIRILLTGAVTGGLAGIHYRVANIPTEWLEQIARKSDIIDLANRVSLRHSKSGCRERGVSVLRNGCFTTY